MGILSLKYENNASTIQSDICYILLYKVTVFPIHFFHWTYHDNYLRIEFITNLINVSRLISIDESYTSVL